MELLKQHLANLWLQHPSDMHRGRATSNIQTHTHIHTCTCTRTHQKTPRQRDWKKLLSKKKSHIRGKRRMCRAECRMLPVLIPRSTAHPPTGLGQASAPSLSLDFLIFKAEISIPAYLTEGESN